MSTNHKELQFGDERRDMEEMQGRTYSKPDSNALPIFDDIIILSNIDPFNSISRVIMPAQAAKELSGIVPATPCSDSLPVSHY